jgi:hypothetical protein
LATRSLSDSFVNQITSLSAYLDVFLAKLDPLDAPRVILITERKTTSPIYKGLAKSYKGKLIFGEVRSSLLKGKVADELMDRYEIDAHTIEEKQINLFVVKSDGDGTQAIVRYTSKESDFESLSNFLKLYTSTKFKRQNAPRSHPKGVIHTLTDSSYQRQKLCHKESSDTCILLLSQEA